MLLFAKPKFLRQFVWPKFKFWDCS